MARHTAEQTKNEIIQVALRMFLEKGYSKTTIKAISEELDISTGNLTFHYPTKEHLLAKLVEMLCSFQRKMVEQATEKGQTSLLAIGMELAAMAAICEEDEIARDFYLAAYKHAMSLDLIRKSDMARAKIVFKDYCDGWTESQFQQAEIIVSGIEYATLMKTGDLSLEERISGALNGILSVYHVPAEMQEEIAQKVFDMDYYQLGRRLLNEFKDYVIGGNIYD